MCSCSIRQNALLATLPAAVQERLAPNLKLVNLPLGMVLYEVGDKRNRHHTIDQRLCRLLLLSLDRLPGNRILMTQALIANMLGVRREGATEAAGKLQKQGIIE